MIREAQELRQSGFIDYSFKNKILLNEAGVEIRLGLKHFRKGFKGKQNETLFTPFIPVWAKNFLEVHFGSITSRHKRRRLRLKFLKTGQESEDFRKEVEVLVRLEACDEDIVTFVDKL